MAETETWLNSGKGEIWIVRFDHSGKLKEVPVRAGRQIVLETRERQINQDRAALPSSDPFLNGDLVPVRLVDSAEDYAEIANNPNHISEDDMKALFKLKAADFKERIGEITNSATINRILEIANDDSLKLNVTLAQMKALEARVQDVQPKGVTPITMIENVREGD